MSRLFMFALSIALLVLSLLILSCKRRALNSTDVWSGVDRTKIACDYPSNYGTRVFCVAEGVAYFCVGYDRVVGDLERRQWECAPVRSLSELEKP